MDYHDPGSAGSLEKDAGTSAIELSEREDLEQKLALVEKKKSRHLLWLILGISPAAVIPAAGLLAGGEMALLVLLIVLVFIGQVYGLVKRSMEASDLKKELLELSERG